MKFCFFHKWYNAQAGYIYNDNYVKWHVCTKCGKWKPLNPEYVIIPEKSIDPQLYWKRKPYI
jgi:hypothetical protein